MASFTTLEGICFTWKTITNCRWPLKFVCRLITFSETKGNINRDRHLKWCCTSKKLPDTTIFPISDNSFINHINTGSLISFKSRNTVFRQRKKNLDIGLIILNLNKYPFTHQNSNINSIFERYFMFSVFVDQENKIRRHIQ